VGTPFHIAHQGLNDLDIQKVLSKIYSYLCPELHFMSPHLVEENFNTEKNGVDKEFPDVENGINGGRNISNHAYDIHDIIGEIDNSAFDVVLTKETVTPIRLGVVSAHMFDHSIGRILVELIVLLHEKGAKLNRPIHIIVFFVDRKIIVDHDKPSDYKQFYRTDYITNILRNRLGDQNFRCLPASLGILHTEISKENLDFLIFADLGMDFTTYALAHARLARYQVS
jgi:hypothetical protein